MKRLIISISVLMVLASSNIEPTFAQTNEQQVPYLPAAPNELTSTENEEITISKNYVDELNKLGIAGRSESDNAAPFYQKAMELYVKEPEGLKVTIGGWPKELPAQEQARKWVKDNNTALEQLQLGSQKSYCFFKHTGEKLQVDMPYLPAIRELAYTLQARVIIQAEEGNINSAINDIVTLYKYGSHVAAGPKPLVEKQEGWSVKSLSITAAFNILEKEMLDASMMKDLQDKLEQVYTEYDEPFDIRYEKFYLQEQVETTPEYQSQKAFLENALEYYDTVSAKTPWQLHTEQTQSTAAENPLIENLGPSIDRVIEIDYRSRAETQALITTLAILRYNTERDGYPTDLPELVSVGYIKEVPIDPFSDKFMIYIRIRENFTLYSYGADYDDDGGQHSNWGTGEEGGDRVFWPVKATISPDRQLVEQAPSIRPQQERQEGTQKPMSASDRGKAVLALHQAIVDGDVKQVQLLIEGGADISAQNRMGWTPLHTAVRNRKQDVVKLLIEKGADVNSTGGVGRMPLHFAVETRQIEVVELLITKGADINAMDGRGGNALSLAQKNSFTEITELLLKHGAEEPRLELDEYSDPRGGSVGMDLYPAGTMAVGQSPDQIDVLADPNEIRARIKTFEGLEKMLKEIDANSISEMRLWQRIRTDNRTSLIRAVQKQLEAEIGFIRKVAGEEEAKKTVEEANTLLSMRQERFGTIRKELLAQRRELRQAQPTRTRGRTRGRTTQTQDEYVAGQSSGASVADPYTTRSGFRTRMGATGRADETQDPEDTQTENEISQWLEATIDNKEDLANAVNEQIMTEFTFVRTIAVREEAKKTTAAIEGLMLSRRQRFEELIVSMAEEREKQALRMQALEQRSRGRTGGRRDPQSGQMEQGSQPGTQVRRRR